MSSTIGMFDDGDELLILQFGRVEISKLDIPTSSKARKPFYYFLMTRPMTNRDPSTALWTRKTRTEWPEPSVPLDGRRDGVDTNLLYTRRSRNETPTVPFMVSRLPTPLQT